MSHPPIDQDSLQGKGLAASKRADQAAHDAAMKAAARTLLKACTFAALHATDKPLFKRTMKRPQSPAVVVRMVWPGVLQVCDPHTGDVLAESEPGNPHQLKAGFVPGAVLAPAAR